MKPSNVFGDPEENEFPDAALVNFRDLPSGDHSLTPHELCCFDDMATTLVIDSVLDFKTHKMNQRKRYIRQDERLTTVSIMREFRASNNFSLALVEFFSLRSVKDFLLRFSLQKQLEFRDHIYQSERPTKAGLTVLFAPLAITD
ncbi:hypothetical protein RB195_018556 [Necator americanus]|uniref:Ras-GEF domain-containing protein n=1 Tax=Necator americanus TaxID=51031 RepID=A0ABR1CC75_NECAM